MSIVANTDKNLNKNKGSLYIVSAPSGAGKTSLVNKLLQLEKNIHLSISHTTRSKRPNEQDGVNYYFIDENKFQAMVANNEFIEYATVFGKHYGTSIEGVDKFLKNGKDVILEIDWQGARLVREKFSNCVSIYILPPSVQALEHRLTERKQDSGTIIEKRMHEAVTEMEHYSEFDYLVVNEDFDIALKELQSIVQATRLLTTKQIIHHEKLIYALLHAK